MGLLFGVGYIFSIGLYFSFFDDSEYYAPMIVIEYWQLRTRWGAGGQSSPRDLTGKFLLTYREK